MSEWQCSYCKRVNDFSHKTCDGCGASKPFYRNLPSMEITTAGTSRGRWEKQGGFLGFGKQYVYMVDEPDYGELARYGI